MTRTLLTREEFREAVLSRDQHRCVLCKQPAVDAHHLLERRLWPDGGYYLDNGASVCAYCHLECERTLISVEELRAACGILKPILPPHLYADQAYDKWGNILLPNGTRLKGELFFDESVQRALTGTLGLFTSLVKYPRTHHLPWSENMNDEDRMMDSLDAFIGQRVIVTEKMDGENSSLYQDHIHARSVTSETDQTRAWLKNFWSKLRLDIPAGWRVCGENMWAKHSIAYTFLPSYFLGFSIWNEKNECLSWDETLEWFTLLGITPVPILYDGLYHQARLVGLYGAKCWTSKEGYVVRVADQFPYSRFKTCVGKFVRKNHVQTVEHWRHGLAIHRNSLAKIDQKP